MSILVDVTAVFICLLFSAMFVASVLNMDNTIINRYSTTWNEEPLNEFCSVLKKEIPKDTMAIGLGVPELYAKIGWKTGIYTIDWSDMNSMNIEYINERVQKENTVFAHKDAIAQLACAELYVCIKEYEINGNYYGYYIKQ